MTHNIISDEALDQLFRKARTLNAWKKEAVSDDLLKQIYEVMKFGPTSANCCPLRIVFVNTEEGRARLKPALDAGNVEKTMAAPVTAIFARDMKFYENLPKLFPHTDAKSWFVGNDALIRSTAVRNTTLQAAYFMIVARGFGLDCGPMSGFNNDMVNKEFFPDGRYEVDFICSLGYGDPSKTFPRSPRLQFSEACSFA